MNYEAEKLLNDTKPNELPARDAASLDTILVNWNHHHHSSQGYMTRASVSFYPSPFFRRCFLTESQEFTQQQRTPYPWAKEEYLSKPLHDLSDADQRFIDDKNKGATSRLSKAATGKAAISLARRCHTQRPSLRELGRGFESELKEGGMDIAKTIDKRLGNLAL